MVNVETLMALRSDEIPKISAFRDYKPQASTSLFFGTSAYMADHPIKSVHIQKLEPVNAKESYLDIFNLQIQVVVKQRPGRPEERTVAVTVGNLNSSGIAI
jgi:hypothetical protein